MQNEPTGPRSRLVTRPKPLSPANPKAVTPNTCAMLEPVYSRKMLDSVSPVNAAYRM